HRRQPPLPPRRRLAAARGRPQLRRAGGGLDRAGVTYGAVPGNAVGAYAWRNGSSPFFTASSKDCSQYASAPGTASATPYPMSPAVPTPRSTAPTSEKVGLHWAGIWQLAAPMRLNTSPATSPPASINPVVYEVSPLASIRAPNCPF